MGEILVHGDDNHLPDIPHGCCHGQWSCHHHCHQWLCQPHEHSSKLACNHPDGKVRAHHENKEMTLTFNIGHHCKMMCTVVHCQIHYPCPHFAALAFFTVAASHWQTSCKGVVIHQCGTTTNILLSAYLLSVSFPLPSSPILLLLYILIYHSVS